MKIIILSFFIAIVLSGWADVAQNPMPSVIKGTPAKFFLDEKASANYYFRPVSVPSFVTISTEGLVNCDSKQTGSYPVEVKVYDKVSGKSQPRQYVLKVLDQASEKGIWAYNTTNYYARASAQPFRVILNDNSPSNVKVGNDFKYTFKAENGNGNLVYAFFGLPEGITADQKSGVISGKFPQPGIYTLGCEVGDQLGNSADGFLTVTVTAPQNTQLSTVQLENKVTYKLNYNGIKNEQVTADKQLFDALAVVNAAKAKLAAKQDALKKLQAELAVAQSNADAAANAAAKAKAQRERAADRLASTNKALSEAQDALNLALLEQAAAADTVIAAQDAVAKATQRFTTADTALKNAQAKVQSAEADMAVCRENLLKAQNALKNAKKEFDRASQDLSDAKGDLESGLRRKTLADDDVQRARDALKLAQQAYNDAQKLLDSASQSLKAAGAQRQQCLANLADAKYALEQSKNDLGAAEWNLEKTLSLLYQAQARKEAADRASALSLAEGAKYLNGSSPVFNSLGGWGKDNSNTSYIIQAAKDFGECGGSAYPKFAGVAKVVDIQAGIATLSTGQQVTFGNCTKGLNTLKPGADIVVGGVVNVDKKVIQAYDIKPATL